MLRPTKTAGGDRCLTAQERLHIQSWHGGRSSKNGKDLPEEIESATGTILVTYNLETDLNITWIDIVLGPRETTPDDKPIYTLQYLPRYLVRLESLA